MTIVSRLFRPYRAARRTANDHVQEYVSRGLLIMEGRSPQCSP